MAGLPLIWTLLGLTAGVAHAIWIWRSANQPTCWTVLEGPVRLLVVGLALVVAAYFDAILPAAAGWAVGFLVSVGVLIATRRWIGRRRTVE